jgi:hypothetical protein
MGAGLGAELGAEQPETIAAIVAAHRAGTLTPAQTVARTYQRIREYNDPAVFISLRDEKDAIAEAEKLAARADAASLPLYGIPVAVKDNIDALGFPTTAACPAFSYNPTHDSTAVSGYAPPARSSSARPISTSSRPASSACVRPTAFPRIRSARISSRADRARARRHQSPRGSCR